MSSEHTHENDASDVANQEDPAALGNSVDGTRTGDGGRSAGTAPRTPGDDSAASAGGTAPDRHADERDEQKEVYQTPDGTRDSAVGGSEGTADGQ